MRDREDIERELLMLRDEVRELSAENKLLRTALKEIAEAGTLDYRYTRAGWMAGHAKDALEKVGIHAT